MACSDNEQCSNSIAQRKNIKQEHCKQLLKKTLEVGSGAMED